MKGAVAKILHDNVMYPQTESEGPKDNILRTANSGEILTGTELNVIVVEKSDTSCRCSHRRYGCSDGDVLPYV